MGKETKTGFPVIAENTRRHFLQQKFSLKYWLQALAWLISFVKVWQQLYIAMTGNPPLCFFLVLKIEKRITQWAMQGQASSKFCQHADLYALVIRSDIILHEYSLTAQPPVFSLKLTWKMALKDKRKKSRKTFTLELQTEKVLCDFQEV